MLSTMAEHFLVVSFISGGGGFLFFPSFAMVLTDVRSTNSYALASSGRWLFGNTKIWSPLSRCKVDLAWSEDDDDSILEDGCCVV
uniref:Uncharacterized protein n=1 Tax=Setaria viridis TaxID=4556 RepID=A0A4U6W2B5_SETVI|nr:hypothetical protein SEVIR_2G373450v2 [Setaria viridis]